MLGAMADPSDAGEGDTGADEPPVAPPPDAFATTGDWAEETTVEIAMPDATAPDIDAAGLTDPGCARAHNEDAYLVASLTRAMHIEGREPSQSPAGHLFAVADGMGGHAAGEVASAHVVDAMAAHLHRAATWPATPEDEGLFALGEALADLLRSVQAELAARGVAQEAERGMGTTLTLAFVRWPKLLVVHVGDSRLYLWRGGQLRQVTRDHTLAQQLVDHAVITPAQAEESEFANVLVNALGGDTEELHVERHLLRLTRGDVLCLCSDGLTKHVPDPSLREVLGEVAESGTTASAAVGRLIDAANDGGGTDNVTVVVAAFR
jgi:serine/threonine protein phosphatase PrpC